MSNLTGKWDVVVHTFIGDQFAFHNLNVDGENLTGTVTDKGNGSEAEVTEGKVNGNKFNYEFKIKIPIGNLKFKIEGEILEDGTIKGISKNAMGKFEFTGVRV